MARVVQRRKTPPYLLIVFVFLFLVAFALLIVTYLAKEDLVKMIDEEKQKRSQLASPTDLRLPDVQTIIEQAKKASKPGVSGTPGAAPLPDAPTATTVIGYFDQQVKSLAQRIAGTPASYQAAIELCERTVKGGTGLVSEIQNLAKERDAAKAEYEKAKGVAENLHKQLTEKEAAQQKIIEKASKDKEPLIAQIKQLTDKVQSEHDEYLKKSAAEKEAYEKLAAEKDKNVQRLVQQVGACDLKIQEMGNAIAKLREDKKKLQPGTPDIEARKVDGKVLRVIEQNGMCYLNLGTKDKVVPGQTFTVYPPTGVSESGVGKATIVVMSAGDNLSECRIVTQKRDDPVVSGDLVANIAYNAVRAFSFVVEGEFDLYNRGKATAAGAEEVKALIKRYGGNVTKEIGLETDFVVLGVEPTSPPKPADGSPAVVLKAYEDQKKIYDNYNQVRSQAKNMRITTLNATRFLSMIGFTPTKGGI